MKTVHCFIFCLLTSSGMAQNINQSIIRDSLFQKSRNQKTTGWIMVGGGAASIIAGLSLKATVDDFVNPFEALDKSNYHGFEAKTFLIGGGVVLAGCSYFLFKASANTKRQAMRINITTQNTRLPARGGWTITSQPSLSLCIPVNRVR